MKSSSKVVVAVFVQPFGAVATTSGKSVPFGQENTTPGVFDEGISVADPAEHGIYIEGRQEHHCANYIKWVKNISWRVNNEGAE